MYNFFQRIKRKLLSNHQTIIKTEPVKEKIIRNVFNKHYSKNALVSFIINPFTEKKTYFYHTNQIECKIMAEVLDELGYNVDVIDLDACNTEFTINYDLVVGFGQPIEELLIKDSTKKFKLVIYRNGTDAIYSDDVSLERLSDFQRKTGQILLESAPLYPYSFRPQLWFADKIIILGNKFVADTYKRVTNAKIESLDLMYFDVGTIDLQMKNFSEARNNFLWFGSRGAVRKGLDLAIDFFKLHPELHLYICGLSEYEQRFLEIYKNDFDLPNIHQLGFMKMESTEFKELVMNCGSVIFPTIWEGGGGAVLNLIAAGGLIPIVPLSLGLDFENNEIPIEGFTVNDIKKSVDLYLQLSDDELKSRAIFLMEYIREKHPVDKFKSTMKNLLTV